MLVLERFCARFYACCFLTHYKNLTAKDLFMRFGVLTLVSVTFVTVLSCIYIFSESTSDEESTRLSSVPESSRASASPASTQTIAKKNASAISDNVDRVSTKLDLELRQRFASTQSYRAMYYEAIKRPKDGGLMYAFAALNACKKQNTNAADIASNSVRLQAATYLNSRCDFSESEMQDARRELAAIREFEFGHDPLLKLTFGLIKPTSSEAYENTVRAILETGDPLAIYSLISPKLGANDNGESIYFAGHDYTGKDAIATVEYAYDLTRCKLGLDCGPTSTRVLQLCAERGWCGDSLSSALQLGLSNNSAITFSTVQQLSANMLTEITRKNAAAFIKK